MSFGWKTFNDRLALVFGLAILGLWLLQGFGLITLPPEIVGATIVSWTMVIQYYFRRAPPNGGAPPSP